VTEAPRSPAGTSPSTVESFQETAIAQAGEPGTVATPVPSLGNRAIRRLAVALSHRDFRVLWFGACTSSIGTWMQQVAQSWLVLELTNSATYVALDTFLGQVPIVLFTLIGGVVADRRNRRKLLLASQIVQMATAFALALLVVFQQVHVWHILALSFVSGCAQAFGGPAYQSLLPSLVSKDHVANAVALNSIQFNLARWLGPALAGVVLNRLGMVACFTLNGISFLVVIGALLSLHVQHVPRPTERRLFDELTGGVNYVRTHSALFSLTLLAFAATFFGTPLLTLLPVVARNLFHGGVDLYSAMLSWSGAGAVGGAIVVAWLGRFRHMGLTALLVLFGSGLLIAMFAITRLPWLAFTLLLLNGAALVATLSLTTSLAQLSAPNDMRGRVMSIYMLALRGGMPLGSLVSGFVAERTNVSTAVALNGVLLSVVAGWFLLRGGGVRDLGR
jgi:MFS family permease